MTFANEFKTARGISRVFLAGDFNAYSEEDPIQVLKDAGYANLESSSKPDEETYNFDGMVGSLDHVLANAAALEDVNAVDIWDINGYESVYYEYARFNTNVTNLYAPNPFRSSDHSPEIVGINVVDPQPVTTTVTGSAPPIESFINDDKPTIDVLNEMGLDVSAVGNHELDQGYDDLVDRVMAPESESNPHGGAAWQYVAANIEEPGGADDIAESWTAEVDGVTVGFVGAVTEDLPSLVSPDGIAGLTVTDIVDSTNAEAAALTEAGADVVVLLVHEGAPVTSCSEALDGAWGEIVEGVSPDVDAIVSGHTHLESTAASTQSPGGAPARDRSSPRVSTAPSSTG